jgi:hypothetical protein
VSEEPGLPALPAIKFFKNTVPDILSGGKTLEPRPRSDSWITTIQSAARARLTYGPRMGAQTVFAIARIISVEIRGLETATQEDVDRIGSHLAGRDPAEFAAAYTRWYGKELAKGYRVAWVSFEVDQEASP